MSVRSTTYRHRVRYLEVDQQGVVFNMWYLGYFDEAMTLFLEEGGLEYQDMLDAGFDVQLVRSEIDWQGPLRWPDEAVVKVRLERTGTTSFTLRFDVGSGRHGGGTLATGRTVYVVVRTDGSGKVAIPDRLRSAIGEAATEEAATGDPAIGDAAVAGTAVGEAPTDGSPA